MTGSLQRFSSAGVLAVWGLVLGYFVVSGRLASYLHPSFHVWTAGSAVVLLLLATGVLFLPEQSHHECESGCDHPHDQPKRLTNILAAAILVLPVMMAATISPDQFGAVTINNRGYIASINDLPGYQPYVEPALPGEEDSRFAGNSTADNTTAADSSAGNTTADDSYISRNATGQIKAQTIDLLYAAEEPTIRADFEGKEVEIIGQFMPASGSNAQKDRFNLVRMFIICCAADGRPVAIPVQSDQAHSVAEMSWVKVTGTATFPLEGGRRVPLLVAKSVTPCDPPEETFIY